ncbi:group I truncated hemoglobin [Albimonas pacifica]|uniref:Hemoglobin n=1 Tax=Albimonas pacifica TaxID=1114924 RepID=A0A1I3BXL1_9RHOB|nr:group 1 truncated hemoglobin [Albimonas pacifica]SFH67037.1 hemoglobin [Albimonas pacifica]
MSAARVAASRSLPLFEKYGGMSVLRGVIMDFYDRALDSDLVGPFFEQVDMARLIDHQTKFMAMLLGGPASFAEERLARAHAHLGVTHAHFDEIAALISATLADSGFSDEDRRAVLAAVEARRPLIVG